MQFLHGGDFEFCRRPRIHVFSSFLFLFFFWDFPGRIRPPPPCIFWVVSHIICSLLLRFVDIFSPLFYLPDRASKFHHFDILLARHKILLAPGKRATASVEPCVMQTTIFKGRGQSKGAKRPSGSGVDPFFGMGGKFAKCQQFRRIRNIKLFARSAPQNC